MKKVFKKSDVKSGMLVKTRNGMYFTVVDAMVTVDDEVGLAVVSGSNANNRYFPLDDYNDDLLFANDLGDDCRKHDYDIVEVWGHTYPKFAMDNSTYDRAPIWIRTETDVPDPNAKKWDEMTDEEKDAVCEKHDSCGECSYEKECDADGEDEDEDDYKPKPKADEDEPDIATTLDELREMCKDDPLSTTIFEVLGRDLPKSHFDYILGKTDKNPEREAPVCGKKSLAEALYERDKKMAEDGVSVAERNIALLAAMYSSFEGRKD